MADMGEMEMAIPDNTLPMMTGRGPYGALEMGGMFTVLKVRRDQKPGDYRDPGWYRQPRGTQAFEWNGSMESPQRAPGASPEHSSSSGHEMPQTTEVRVRKPGTGKHHF